MSQRAEARFGRREGSLSSPYGVFEAAELPQKRWKYLLRRESEPVIIFCSWRKK